jgi:hypothetical protein
MHIPDDLNNRRIRQLIEQFNAEEEYELELGSAIEELRKLIASKADLADLMAALRKARWKLPTPPPVNAIGILAENSFSHR